MFAVSTKCELFLVFIVCTLYEICLSAYCLYTVKDFLMLVHYVKNY